ncbi:hypothetical protein [Streptomyces rochei]|uniref:hypothetical protein n=1 Tax=Streptomyces rochei TaxID=1928 RepID=UPI0037B1A3A9
MTDQTTETDEQRTDREEIERDHARGDHSGCGVECEAIIPTEHLRNMLLYQALPGAGGALAELERRAGAGAVLPATTDQTPDRAAVLREAADALERRRCSPESVDIVLRLIDERLCDTCKGYGQTATPTEDGGFVRRCQDCGGKGLRRMADEAQPTETTTVALPTLAAALDGLHTLIATSSRDWGTYRVDAWIWAVLCGWDCEYDHEHDDLCENGAAMAEMAERHGWDDATVAKARRYRAAVRALTEQQPVAGARQDEAQPSTPPCAHCNHPKGDHDGHVDHRAKYPPHVAGDPWCHACNAPCDYAAAGARQDGAQR